MTDYKTVNVDLGVRSYPIYIGAGCIEDSPRLLSDIAKDRQIIIIADENVDATIRPRLDSALILIAKNQKISVLIPPVPSGEGSKSIRQYNELMEKILSMGVDRQVLLVALGGGVIGDLVGFVAATLLRGVDYIQVPTTLLAMVDSSVGGKTGINAKAGKNLIGAFHQPKAVLIDPECLAALPERELPEREIRAGYAEIVKYALLGDKKFFADLQTNLKKIMAKDPQILAETIEHCCQMKADIVAADEKEKGKRALLNLGHTFAHAYEAEAGYDGSILHGEAVAVGICDAFRLGVKLKTCSPAELEQVQSHFKAAELPTIRTELGRLSEKLGKASPESLIEHMRKDKKNTKGNLTFILPHGIGDARIKKDINENTIIEILKG